MVGQESLQNADMSWDAGDNAKRQGEAVARDVLRQEQLAQAGRDLFGKEELFSATLDLETMSGASNTSQLHKQSVSAKFFDQMHELTDTLSATRCNFIRCIKPNPTRSPGIFDHVYVVDQLRCSGMLATCELLKVGLPTRVAYEKICRIYKPVLPPSVTPMFDAYNDRTFTEAVMWSFRVEPDVYRRGRTKVLFKTGKIALLDAMLKVDMKKMGPWIVARLRKWLARRRLRYALAKVLAQRTFLRLLEDTRRRKAAIVKMQARMRMFAICKQFIRARNAHHLKVHRKLLAKKHWKMVFVDTIGNPIKKVGLYSSTKRLNSMRFRPCIDIHAGEVKQIVGSTLTDCNETEPITNFVASKSAGEFARMYKRDGLVGGHVIMLGTSEANTNAVLEALEAFPGGLQVGGGITADNWASHVIVTFYVFCDGQIDFDRLDTLRKRIGKKKLVLDLSCRQSVKDNKFYVMTNRWQTLATTSLEYVTVCGQRQHMEQKGVDVVSFAFLCSQVLFHRRYASTTPPAGATSDHKMHTAQALASIRRCRTYDTEGSTSRVRKYPSEHTALIHNSHSGNSGHVNGSSTFQVGASLGLNNADHDATDAPLTMKEDAKAIYAMMMDQPLILMMLAAPMAIWRLERPLDFHLQLRRHDPARKPSMRSH
ncbi:hypothetical protein PsorP6_013415 [Peronosclerospora sorghi]|uniref:Uncharacterized protein n=1 Tax=Peronosclerospora sorghi TaxID=230839 RepID=A0ACC0VHS6_9STRA|nr:hypothetical protein PsorP6_013415 [Peronosclerospora sorghi]